MTDPASDDLADSCLDDFRRRYESLLAEIGNNKDKLRDALTLFVARKGNQATKELMVVGRAVNEGAAAQRGNSTDALPADSHRWHAADVADPKTREGLILSAFSKIQSKCPMAGITDRWSGRKNAGYNIKQSQFWKLVHAVYSAVAGKEMSDWPSRLIWSNLYKVSAADKQNPGRSLRRIQRPCCVEILRTELQLWKPKRLLLLTGMNWASPFLGRLGEMAGQPSEGLLQFVGSLAIPGCSDPISLVVASHPQGKRHDELKRLILDAFALPA